MSIKTHILFNSKDLKPFENQINKIVIKTETIIEKIIPIGDIEIVFYDNPSATLKESGIGGYTPCANVIFFSLDPRNINFKKEIEKELFYQLVHEINHAIRFRTPIPKETLFEAMISEGLADHFAMQITGRNNPPAWCEALTSDQKEKLKVIASNVWNDPTYNHNEWFYGTNVPKIPRWTAYTLGYDIVSKYLQANPKIKASEIISASAEIFV